MDTGEGKTEWFANLQQVLDEEHACVSTVLITHGHYDHTGGIGQLAALNPAPLIFKHNPAPGQCSLNDGATFNVEGASVRAMFAPGHTSDHTVIILKDEDAMFTGDNVLGKGTAVFEDLSMYLQSLRAMREAFTGRAYPGHGPVIADGPGKITEYIRHREMREAQVVAVLRSCKSAVEPSKAYCAWSSHDITERIYPDLAPELFNAAERGIVLILEKLEHEAKVYHDIHGQTWQLLDGR